ncbi:hypothetical protein HK102_006170, partial [Quaeritorhiza haematococci]
MSIREEAEAALSRKLVSIETNKITAKELEKTIYNHAVILCREKNIFATMDDFYFLKSYRHRFLVIYNNLTPHLLSKIESDPNLLCFMSHADFRPELWTFPIPTDNEDETQEAPR